MGKECFSALNANSAIRSDAFPKNRSCANLPTIFAGDRLHAANASEQGTDAPAKSVVQQSV